MFKNLQWHILFLFITLFLSQLVCLNAPAQDLQKEFEEFLTETREEFQTTLAGNEREMQLFLDSLNKDYLNSIRQWEEELQHLLKGEWISPELNPGDKADTLPGPQKMPRYSRASGQISSVSAEAQLASGNIPPVTYTGQHISILPEGDSLEQVLSCSFRFYGKKLDIAYDPGLAVVFPAKTDKYAIAHAREILNQTRYHPLLGQFLKIQKETGLNSWGWYKLISTFSREIHKGDANSATLLSWFLLQTSSYRAKLGISGNTLVLLLPVQQKILEKSYIKINGTRYYAMDFQGGQIVTCPGNYKGAGRVMDLSLNYPLELPLAAVEKRLNFAYDKDYSFLLQTNRNIIDYYTDYPLTDISVYQHTALSLPARESLIAELGPLISGLNYPEKISFLLSFVQQAFPYQADDRQFGREKPFFPDEMLFYPYSDCEDRALFFNQLVDLFTGEKALLLLFPGHAASAVPVQNEGEGFSLVYEGQNFLACDPSYLGAPPGELIPEFSTKEFHAIQIGSGEKPKVSGGEDFPYGTATGTDSAAVTAVSFTTLQEIQDNRGNRYTIRSKRKGECGVWNAGDVSSDDSILLSEGEGRCRVWELTAWSKDDSLLWQKEMYGEYSVYPWELLPDESENLYVTGSYIDTLRIDTFTRVNRDLLPGYFLLKIGLTGETAFLSEIPLLNQAGYYDRPFTARFDSTGRLELLGLSENRNQSLRAEVETDKAGNHYLQAVYFQPRLYGPDSVSYASGRDFDIVSRFFGEYNLLEETGSDKLVAFTWALFGMLRNEGVSIGREKIQQILDQTRVVPETLPLKQVLSPLDKLANFNGVIRMTAHEPSPLQIDKLIIEPGARCRVARFPGKMKLDMIDGCYHGTQWHRDLINFIDIQKDNNQIIFDYDRHYNKKLLLQSDLL